MPKQSIYPYKYSKSDGEMHPLKLFSVMVVLASLFHEVLSQLTNTRFKTAVMPIAKDPQMPLYKVGLRGRISDPISYLIDLDAPFIWMDCIMKRPPIACSTPECYDPIPCDSPVCVQAHSYANPLCPPLNMTAKYGCSICTVTPMNPVANICKISQLTTDWLFLSATDGSNPTTSTMFLPNFTFSCAPASIMRSLPKGVIGVAAFSWSNLALSGQFSYLNVAKKFALCLPNSSLANGVSFFGDGPFYLPPFPNLDLRSLLSYTPIRNTSKSLGYYIRLNAISIDGKHIPLPFGNGFTVKISTIVPYTTLRSDIYNSFIKSFSKAAKSIPRAKAVKPFSLCLKSTSIGSNVRTGLEVPVIDLEVEGGKFWTIFGGNSMKQVGKGVACLAFVDGGTRLKEGIVIGSFQMEDNFLFFDMENLKLGFSSSLLPAGMSCGNFNFTAVQE